MVDVLLKLRYFEPVFGEVPMLLRYDQKHGPSKMQVGRTASQTVRLLLRRRFERKPEIASDSDANAPSAAFQPQTNSDQI